MFDSLFGAEMPLAVRFFLAFLIVLGLIGATAWAVRRFGTGRLGGSNTRGRQPRLAVIDYASVDARRRLILVRRDNVEHLLMIGGPTDVVVEANIVRAVSASRDVTGTRPADAGPRALSESGANGSWPLQPDSTGHRPSSEAPSETPSWPLQPHTETPGRTPRDTLTALADEIAPRPFPMRGRSSGNSRGNSSDSRGEPRMPTANAESTAAADQSLAEMAHRLEAALRKPSATAEAQPAAAPAEPPAAAAADAPEAAAAAPEGSATPAAATPQRSARVVEAKPARDAKQPMPSKTLYDSLEQEMASLLGRPTGKT